MSVNKLGLLYQGPQIADGLQLEEKKLKDVATLCRVKLVK